MLASVLIRLVMIMLTLMVVCWIGWNVPASRDAETLHAAALPEADRPAAIPSLSESRTAADPPAQQHQTKSSRQASTIMLDLNRATHEEFERLPGIGPVLAGRIVEYREVRGAFRDVEQLRRVKGIGKKTYERIRPLVAVMPRGVSRPPRKTT
jgi:competence protein ComEA